MGYVNKTYLSTQFKNFADKIAKVFSKIGHTHLKSDITDFPTSMPANGGNAATVGGHTVGVNVPSNAKFTDTTYSKLSEFTDDVGYVKDTDSRLSDARNAKDVYAWAKAPTKPTYTANEIGALKAYNIQYQLPANNGGWHKIAKITNTPTPYWSFDLYATGGWNYVAKSNAHFHILNRNGTVIIEQISGIVGSGIVTIRMVRESDSSDVWILEEFSSNSPGKEYYSFTICGDVGLTPLDGELDTNDASVYKATVTLPVVNIPTGNNITSGNIQEQSVKHANSSDKVGHTLSIGVVKGAAKIYTFDGSQDVNFDIQIPTTASEVGAVPISGEVHGAITFGKNDAYGIRTNTNNFGRVGDATNQFYEGYFYEIYENKTSLSNKYLQLTGDSKDNIVTFTSNDSITGDSTAPPVVITSGETHASLFNKLSTAVKNVRWLLSKMGTTDISTLGDGTVTGALSTLNSNKVTNAITASGTVSAIAYSGTCDYHIFGKLCCVNGEFMYSSNYTPTNTQVIFKNLPIPVRPYYITALQYRGGRVDALFTGSIPFKMRINAAGEIQNWYSGILTLANNPATFSFVYPIK